MLLLLVLERIFMKEITKTLLVGAVKLATISFAALFGYAAVKVAGEGLSKKDKESDKIERKANVIIGSTGLTLMIGSAVLAPIVVINTIKRL